ncbi:hypothetical protein PR048_019279 [Dryococelus australis]|uniref:Uncharacterized protein n=1 Tax=Dryococelus australis TaxID=614101 RepID=A0ABQ9H356_9NEOP|nr:hypothetical protein PR048_019279 [Dryococelus australis]
MKRGESGAAPEGKGGENGISPRKPADRRNCPSRLPRGKIRDATPTEIESRFTSVGGRSSDHEATAGPSAMNDASRATAPAYLEHFPSFEDDKCGNDEDDTATLIKCAIATKRKSLNRRVLFSSHCMYLMGLSARARQKKANQRLEQGLRVSSSQSEAVFEIVRHVLITPDKVVGPSATADEWLVITLVPPPPCPGTHGGRIEAKLAWRRPLIPLGVYCFRAVFCPVARVSGFAPTRPPQRYLPQRRRMEKLLIAQVFRSGPAASNRKPNPSPRPRGVVTSFDNASFYSFAGRGRFCPDTPFDGPLSAAHRVNYFQPLFQVDRASSPSTAVGVRGLAIYRNNERMLWEGSEHCVHRGIDTHQKVQPDHTVMADIFIIALLGEFALGAPRGPIERHVINEHPCWGEKCEGNHGSHPKVQSATSHLSSQLGIQYQTVGAKSSEVETMLSATPFILLSVFRL